MSNPTLNQLMVKTNLAALAKLQEIQNRPLLDASSTDGEMSRRTEQINDEIAALMLDRFVINNPETALLTVADAKDIAVKIMREEGTQTIDTAIPMIFLIKRVAQSLIETWLLNLTAIDPDPYTALWKFADKLTKEVVDAGDMPEKVIGYPALWEELYTREEWDQLTVALSAKLAKISLTDVLGKAELPLTENEVDLLHNRIDATWPKGTQGRERVEQFVKIRDEMSGEIFDRNNS